MIYVVNLNYIFLAYETAVDYHVPGAKGCVTSFIEDKVLACVFCDSRFKLHHSPLPLWFYTVFEIRASSAFLHAKKMFLFFIFMNGHIIYLEYSKRQQVLMQAASKTSQQTM